MKWQMVRVSAVFLMILVAFYPMALSAVTSEAAVTAFQDPVRPDTTIKVSNVFYETDIRQALEDLAVQSGIPIISDNTVQGYVTMEINELPLEEALSRILSIGGFTFKKLKGYYLVGLADPNNPSFGLLSVTENILVNYLPAETAAEMLSDYYKPYIKANKILNCISVTASPELITKIREDLSHIDQAPRQVMLEALVTEVKDGVLTSIGIDWSLFAGSGNESYSATNNMSVGLLDTLNALFSVFGANTAIGKNLNLMATLKALAQDGKAEIKANPKVVVTNAQPAEIVIAKEQYFSVVTGPLNYPYTRLEKVSIGIKLTITPYISTDDEITVTIAPEVSDAVGYGREGLPVVDTRKVTTTVRVKDGQTITIGGLTQENTRKVQNKIPILGHIPILGYLFSHTEYEKQKTDIVIFITPRIKKEWNPDQ